MVTLDRLRYFVEVASLEHVGKASKNLAISPSVISAAIQSLETELNCSLFLRENNRIRLTQEGFILLGKAKEILDATEKLRSEISSVPTIIKGHYKIGASHFLMQEYVIPAFLDIQKKHSLLTIEFIALDTGVAISQVLSGFLDAALVFRSSYHHDLEENILYSENFEFTVRKNHPILSGSSKNMIQAINELPAITFRTSIGPNFCENHPVFKELGINPKHTYFYEDTQTVLQLLHKTNGWAFLPENIIKKNKGIKKIKLNKKFQAPVNISLIRHKNRSHSSFIELFKNQITKTLHTPQD